MREGLRRLARRARAGLPGPGEGGDAGSVHGYKNAIDEHLENAIAVLDAFHVVKLGTAALDEVRRRVQQDIHGHRGRKGVPLYGIRNILRTGAEHLTERQQARLARAIAADERHEEVHLAWQVTQRLRSAPQQADDLAVATAAAQRKLADNPGVGQHCPSRPARPAKLASDLPESR